MKRADMELFCAEGAMSATDCSRAVPLAMAVYPTRARCAAAAKQQHRMSCFCMIQQLHVVPCRFPGSMTSWNAVNDVSCHTLP